MMYPFNDLTLKDLLFEASFRNPKQLINQLSLQNFQNYNLTK